jgi:integrase
MFYLLWQCGLRSSEVEELRQEDLDLGGRKIGIRDGKGRKDRTVYATETTVQALREYLAVRGDGSADHVFLFRNAPLKTLFVHSRIKTIGKQVGIHVYPHRLRHTCGTQLLNAGCRITSIQKFLGHKRLNTTMIYARALDQTVAEDYFKAMEQVEQKLALSENLDIQPLPVGEMLRMVNVLSGTILSSAQSEIIQELRSGLSFWVRQAAYATEFRELVDAG